MRPEISNKYFLTLPLKWELILFILLFAGAVFLRLYLLSADPPYKISYSTGIETDPPQYTIYARNHILTGDWNPYNDDRYAAYEYSLITAASRIVYGIFGIGTYQANLVGVVISLLSIFLFYLVLRKILGNGTALLALLFIGANYIAIFYGRRPFLENGMILIFITGLCALTYCEKRWIGHFLFGLCTVASILFGKLIALSFLAVPAAYYLYRIWVLKESNAGRQFVAMISGSAVLAVFWIVVVFLPNSDSVAGYVEEQAVGLYGYPDGLESVYKFVRKFISFGVKSEFFERLPFVSAASLLYIILIISRLFSRNKPEAIDNFPHPIIIAIIVWLAGVFMAEMPWNYQPLRYQTVMIFPLGALAAGMAAYLLKMSNRVNLINRSILFIGFLFVLLFLFAYQFLHWILVLMDTPFEYRVYLPYIVGGVIIMMAGYIVLTGIANRIEIKIPSLIRYILAASIVAGSLFIQFENYLAWAKMPLFTTRQASRDLGMILSPEAVISGPYAPALAKENDLGCVIHIFGTSRPDPELFRKYPITHLAVDRGNEQAAREIYPDIMDSAIFVGNYYINCNRVKIYSVWPYTDNEQAAHYRPSDYEKTWSFQDRSQKDSLGIYMTKFLKAYPENQSGYLMAGMRRYKSADYDSAEALFRQAVEFSYTDFNLHLNLGKAMRGKAAAEDDSILDAMGEAEIEMARRLNFYGSSMQIYDEFDTDYDPADRDFIISDSLDMKWQDSLE
jgi:4-amino-4-deoxy-L-arabinose transferase-like glycosyltransferase